MKPEVNLMKPEQDYGPDLPELETVILHSMLAEILDLLKGLAKGQKIEVVTPDLEAPGLERLQLQALDQQRESLKVLRSLKAAFEGLKFPAFPDRVTAEMPDMKGLLEGLKFPDVEVPDEIKVTEFPNEVMELLKHLKNLNKEAGKPLSVRLSDGKKFYKGIATAVGQGMNHYYGGGGGMSPSMIRDVDNILSPYGVVDVDDDASPNYFGFVTTRGEWYILKQTLVSGADTYRYANGGSNYSTNWTSRISLTYDYFHNVF